MSHQLGNYSYFLGYTKLLQPTVVSAKETCPGAIKSRQNYHWVIDLYEMLNLPVILAVIEALQKAAVDHMKEIEKGKTDHRKKT